MKQTTSARIETLVEFVVERIAIPILLLCAAGLLIATPITLFL